MLKTRGHFATVGKSEWGTTAKSSVHSSVTGYESQGWHYGDTQYLLTTLLQFKKRKSASAMLEIWKSVIMTDTRGVSGRVAAGAAVVDGGGVVFGAWDFTAVNSWTLACQSEICFICQQKGSTQPPPPNSQTHLHNGTSVTAASWQKFAFDLSSRKDTLQSIYFFKLHLEVSDVVCFVSGGALTFDLLTLKASTDLKSLKKIGQSCISTAVKKKTDWLKTESKKRSCCLPILLVTEQVRGAIFYKTAFYGAATCGTNRCSATLFHSVWLCLQNCWPSLL